MRILLRRSRGPQDGVAAEAVHPTIHSTCKSRVQLLHEKRAQTGAVLFGMCLANPNPGKGGRVRQRLMASVLTEYTWVIVSRMQRSLHLPPIYA